jgi:hypothetical protein
MAVTMPKEVQYLREAIINKGFKPTYIRHNYPYARDQSVNLAAFWRQQPFDQFSCGVVGQWVHDGKSINDYLDDLIKNLLPVYTVIARPNQFEIYETVPEVPNGAFIPTHIASCSINELVSTLNMLDGMRPDAIGRRKQRFRQMALFEMTPQAEQFRKWAYEPTQDRLDRLIEKILHETPQLWEISRSTNAEQVETHLRWLIRIFALRIAWDKNMIPNEATEQERPTASKLLQLASHHPTRLSVNQNARTLSDAINDILSDAYLHAVDGALVGQMIQQRALPKQLQKERKLYPTPAHIAWQMLQAIPIEILDPNEMLIWDGTCGTGTILTSALERLRQTVDQNKRRKSEDYLVSAIRGNDLQGLQVDSTRLALDYTLGSLQGRRWQITSHDITQVKPDKLVGSIRPTVIVSNPPFEGLKKQGEYAARVLNVYLDLLNPGSLISVIIPRNLRGAAGSKEKELRSRLRKTLEIFEVIELPVDAFPGAEVEADIIAGRVHYSHQRHFGVLTWRAFASDTREKSNGIQIIANEEAWRTSDHGLRSPLLAKLESHLASNPCLSTYLGPTKPKSKRRYIQGITPGKAAREAGDILDVPDSGASPYLEGRTDMVPFFVPWELNKKWIRYHSHRIQWPRRQHEWLFKSNKLFVSRHKTVGYSWAIRAAVDRERVYPSDQFIVLSPTPECPFSLEQLAGLYNSTLINFWLRESHGGLTLLQDRIASIPLPDWQQNDEPLEWIETISHALPIIMKAIATQADFRTASLSVGETLRGLNGKINNEYDEFISGASNLAGMQRLAAILFRELDRQVFKAYRLPYELTNGIASYFLHAQDSRPGFEEWSGPVVYEPLPEEAGTPPVFTDNDNQRMQYLREKQSAVSLSQEEEHELEKLINLWERANLSATKSQVEQLGLSASLAM